MKIFWEYNELPEHVYMADVSNLGEGFAFRAYLIPGGSYIEGVYKTEEEASAVGVRFAAGEKGIAGLYSAAY